ncbi:Calcium-binding EF-hand [Artemisia annua]|uniref:Calcium-binding EF-hand n=1 Tax=Artemisia annua TaxID=35608 RepID=A0A2U1NXM6_ARTAN|nr:Calcium-binding EF-hand [Artemisia annua]
MLERNFKEFDIEDSDVSRGFDWNSDIDMNDDYAIDKIKEDFEISENGEIEFKEFITGLTKWLEKARGSKRGLHMSGSEIMNALGASVVAAPLVDVITNLSAAIHLFFLRLIHFAAFYNQLLRGSVGIDESHQLTPAKHFLYTF